MSRALSALSSLAAAAALSGCCNGPFVYVDCMGSAITVRVVDAAGAPAAADEVRWSLDGGPSEVADCWGADTGGGCDSWYVPADRDGRVVVEAWLDGEPVGTASIDVVTPPSQPGECCGDVFTADLDVEVS